jgi:hypothetical protein
MKNLRDFMIIVVALFAATASAQEKVETTVSADFVNQYIWRGQDLGDVSLQPTLAIAYKGLSLTAWGSVGLSDKDDTKEFDLTLAYSKGRFNVGITDYWFNNTDGRYFTYAAHTTAHVFEANVGYDFGVASLQWYTNFAGADYFKPTDGGRAYSSYVELNAPFKFAGADWNATIGAVPYKTGFYSDADGGFAVVNVGLKATKNINITEKFALPVFGAIMANPSNEKAYLVFGFTLQP